MYRFIKKLERALALVAGVSLLAMALLTFIDVFGRYGFNQSIFGAAEMVEMLMVLCIFSGLVLVTSANQHITVTIFDTWIQRYVPNLQRWAVLVLMLTVYIFITARLAILAIDGFHEQSRTVVLDWPEWMLPMSASLISAIGIVIYIGVIWHFKDKLNDLKDHTNTPNSDHFSGG